MVWQRLLLPSFNAATSRVPMNTCAQLDGYHHRYPSTTYVIGLSLPKPPPLSTKASRKKKSSPCSPNNQRWPYGRLRYVSAFVVYQDYYTREFLSHETGSNVRYVWHVFFSCGYEQSTVGLRQDGGPRISRRQSHTTGNR